MPTGIDPKVAAMRADRSAPPAEVARRRNIWRAGTESAYPAGQHGDKP
jgi:hypothetical protein